jgi:hypothetical protein
MCNCMADQRQTKRHHRRGVRSQIRKACVKRYEPEAMDGKAPALTVERHLKYSPSTRSVALIGRDAIFTISCPVIVVARAGREFGNEWAEPDKSQQECEDWQQFIECAWVAGHGSVIRPHPSPCTDRLPTNEIASKVATSLKDMRILRKNLYRK